MRPSPRSTRGAKHSRRASRPTKSADQEERLARMGIKDKNKIYEAEDLAPGKQLIFAATGVTDGALLKGVRFFGEGTRTSSVILTQLTGKVRFIESIHLEKGPDVKVRFA
jgi:fructose-1,6-bisphosphatase/sedoheptulose 1,7-bisphosphatase-like protein